LYEEYRKSIDLTWLHTKYVENVPRHSTVSKQWKDDHHWINGTVSLTFEFILSHYRFAFLNAMAAHDYSHNWEQVTVTAE
jgi:hypothetical protein